MAGRLILASGSERRAAILTRMGVGFEVAVPGAAEVFDGADPEGTAMANCGMKLVWCRGRCPEDVGLAADTVIGFEGRCIGKPATVEEAAGFLRMFAGKSQDVLTAVGLGGPGMADRLELVRSTVRFRKLSEAVIAEYLRTVDPLDKAGGYDIDQSGDLIIEGYEGSRTNIMGLPEETVRIWLAELGLLS